MKQLTGAGAGRNVGGFGFGAGLVLCGGLLGSMAHAELPRHLDLLVASRTYGTLFAVDPATGQIRSIVTGPDLRNAAKPVRGTGTLLAGALSGDLGTSRDGRIFWKLAPASGTTATYQIAAATGNRTGLFGTGSAINEANGAPLMLNARTLLLGADGFNQTFSQNSRILRYPLPSGPVSIFSGELVGDGVQLFRGRTLAFGEDHAVYVAEVGTLGGTVTSAGVYRVDLATGFRTLISRTGSLPLFRYNVTNGVQTPSTLSWDRGTGPVTNGQIRSIAYRSGRLYLGVSSSVNSVFYSAIIRIDIATGDRDIVVGTALADDGTGATLLTVSPSNPAAPPFDSASGLTVLADGTIAFSSLFTHNTICRLNPETRELTLIADLGPQVTADVRGKMNFTSLAQFTNCPGDLNLDGVVDDADFVVFVQAYDVLDCADEAMLPPCGADLNGDLFVDDGDFVGFVVGYNGLVCE
ncbi:MAG: hypothetical protein J0L78_16860 [Planctomycetes bacterium]|nr:hypothetical protein [Planctomycetota bacterium]